MGDSNQARARFLRDVSRHVMSIEHDDGVHRCLYFGCPGSSAYSFRLTTWPGHLAISGDMGADVFARIRDMFSFFRSAGPEYQSEDAINPGYWLEKLQSRSRYDGGEVLDEKAYRRAIMGTLVPHVRSMRLSDARCVIEDIRSTDILDPPDDHKEALRIAMEWECPVTGENVFHELWDYQITEPHPSVIWRLHAIQWGIKRYDLHKQGRTQADHDRRVLHLVDTTP